MIRTALILAAGIGTRLGKLWESQPKGFLPVDGITLIERSIRNLLANGIEKIFVGTGFKKEFYEELKIQFPFIECLENPHFSSTGSAATLVRFENLITEDFLLLESDILYEPLALQTLIFHNRPDCILASGETSYGDEVFLEADERYNLTSMTKDRDAIREPYGVLVGISRISHRTFLEATDFILRSRSPLLNYEDVLTALAPEIPIHIIKVPNLVWCEVDDEHHLSIAKTQIAPKLHVTENIGFPIRSILYTPGPATTTNSVKRSQIVTDQCPREKAFGDLLSYLTDELTAFVAPTDRFTAVLLNGSGTAAVESMLSSVVDERPVLIIENGAYGRRMCEIAHAYDLTTVEYKSPWTEALKLEELEKVIDAQTDKIGYLAVVHHETTTGLVNDLTAIGDCCRRRGITLLVDAMSSYAALPIDMVDQNVACLAASSNKNLQGLPGVSFVVAEKEKLERTSDFKRRNYYLDLYAEYYFMRKNRQMRFTPPVQTLYALRQAVIETKIEGIECRYQRYTAIWQVLVDGLQRLELNCLIPVDHQSRLITAIAEPDKPGYSFEAMHDYLLDRGFTIYPGKLQDTNTFRIGTIGDLTIDDMGLFLVALEDYFSTL